MTDIAPAADPDPGRHAAAEAPGALRGAIILAGSHGAIALSRDLARQGLDVWFVTNFTPLPKYSRAISHSVSWPGAEDPAAPDFLEELAQREGLEGYLLVPAADSDVQMVATHRQRLSTRFEVLLPDWEQLRWAADKALTYRKAHELGLAVPENYEITSLSDAGARAGGLRYPVVLKPAMRVTLNRFTRAKVWRADNAGQFVALYREAAELVGAEHVVVQELVPGGGECQLSYASLWWQGRPVMHFTARRTRQFPIDFSYTSTFVETIDAPDVVEAAEKFLSSVGHHGLCEIEFKRDPRSGRIKILDVNPRPWSWFGLADAAGVDFGAAIVDLHAGRPVHAAPARKGVAWMFGIRDMVVAAQLAARGRLNVGAYIASLGRVRTLASLSLRDPLPGLVELPLTVLRMIRRNFSPPR